MNNPACLTNYTATNTVRGFINVITSLSYEEVRRPTINLKVGSIVLQQGNQSDYDLPTWLYQKRGSIEMGSVEDLKWITVLLRQNVKDRLQTNCGR